MKLVPVDSSMLVAVGYDAATKEMEAALSSKGSSMQPCAIGMYSEYRVRRR